MIYGDLDWYGDLDASDYDCCDELKNKIRQAFDDDSYMYERPVACDFPDVLATVHKSERELFLRIRANDTGEILIEGFFPVRFLGANENPCLDLSSAQVLNWPEMLTFLSLKRYEGDEREEMWKEKSERVCSALKDNAVTFTLLSFTDSNKPRLIASIDEFNLIL